jgi:5-methyltetrahydropteroyltriglutamate--homocysteine methyltransferase
VANKYRADHVGSLLRTPRLLDARREHFQGKLPKADLRFIEDNEIVEALSWQKAAGLDVFTDGEYRRAAWSSAWADSVEGLERDTVEATPKFDRLASLRGWKGEHGAEANASMASHAQSGEYTFGHVVTHKLKLRHRLTGHESSFLKGHTDGPTKISIPGVMMAAAGWYRPEKSAAAYPTRAALVEDMTTIVQEEVRALIEEGIDYIQFDSLRYMWFFDADLSKSLHDRGVNMERELEETIASDNACMDGIARDGVTFGLHICRGNNTSAWLAQGGYDAVAERAFSNLRVDRLLLEYDTDRAGGFEPLRFVRKGTTVVLGLISSKVPQLEPQDQLRRRVDQAAKYVPIENLAISPQCGFASSSSGNLLSIDEQRRKLELVADTARRIWND